MSECPACLSHTAPRFLERHLDRISGREYSLNLCPECGVSYSEPRQTVGPDWYEKAAPLRATERRHAPEHDWRYLQFFSDNPASGKLLDVGCGSGDFLLLAKKRGFSAHGFDYESRMVKLAKDRGLSDVESAEFSQYCRGRASREFDAITLFDVLEHTPEPAWFLGEIKRLLKPGGILAITLPNGDRPLPWGREEHDYPPHHFTRWTPKAMRGFLERNGFTILRQESSHLRVAYLADHFFYFVLMRKPLQWARALLFPNDKGTLSELYETSDCGSSYPDSSAFKTPPGNNPKSGGNGWRSRLRSILAKKNVRQAMADALKKLTLPLNYGVAIPLRAYYYLTLENCGDCLYTLARMDRAE